MYLTIHATVDGLGTSQLLEGCIFLEQILLSRGIMLERVKV